MFHIVSMSPPPPRKGCDTCGSVPNVLSVDLLHQAPASYFIGVEVSPCPWRIK